VLMERWDAARGVALIDREQATISMGATPFLQELLGAAAAAGSDLPSLRHYACGGAAVPPELIRRAWRQLRRCRAFRVYGASEVPLVTLGFCGEDDAERAATTDGAIVGYEVRVLREDGTRCATGEEGEICARGPAMMTGYLDPAQTREAVDAEGFFHTGDLGLRTADDALVVTGRLKDLINRGGEKISAREVEDLLHRHPDVVEAAVVAMPHPRLGETPCAFVVPRAGAGFDFAAMTACLRAAGIARQKFPERLVLETSLPRTPSGKIRKDLLRARLAGHGAG
jgi:acyl-CoA synthetase (AMP-forming)/AMP-acid ligase II